MSPSVYDRIRGEVKPGEHLLWCGRPRGGIRVGLAEIGPFIFCLVWIGFTLAGRAYVMVPIGIGLLIYVVYITTWRDPRLRSTTAYGLTDRRVIVIEGWPDLRVQALPLHILTDVTLKERGDHSGTIACFITDAFLQKKNKRGVPVAGSLFRIIVDARHVYDMLYDAQTRLSGGGRTRD